MAGIISERDSFDTETRNPLSIMDTSPFIIILSDKDVSCLFSR